MGTDPGASEDSAKSSSIIANSIAAASLLISVLACLQSCHAAKRVSIAERTTARNEIVEYLNIAASGLVGPNVEFFTATNPSIARQTQEAIANLDKARNLLKVYPDIGRDCQLLGFDAIGNVRLGSTKLAGEILERAKAEGLTSPEIVLATALYNHALYYESNNREQDQELREVAEKSYSHVTLLANGEYTKRAEYFLGLLKMDRRDYVGAIQHLESARSFFDSSAYYHFQLGAAYFGAQYSPRNRKLAIKYSSKAIDLQPHYPSAYFHRGWSRVELAERDCKLGFAEARADLMRAMQQYDYDGNSEEVDSTARDIEELERKSLACQNSPKVE